MPKATGPSVSRGSYLPSASYIIFSHLNAITLYCESVIYSDSKTQKTPLFHAQDAGFKQHTRFYLIL
jgi:hypothetical protein